MVGKFHENVVAKLEATVPNFQRCKFRKSVCAALRYTMDDSDEEFSIPEEALDKDVAENLGIQQNGPAAMVPDGFVVDETENRISIYEVVETNQALKRTPEGISKAYRLSRLWYGLDADEWFLSFYVYDVEGNLVGVIHDDEEWYCLWCYSTGDFDRPNPFIKKHRALGMPLQNNGGDGI